MQIYRYLFRLVGNHEDASDLTQVTFTKAWRGLPGIYDGRRFTGWLYKIATNVALDHFRNRGAHQIFWESLSEHPPDEPKADLEGAMEKREMIQLALRQVAPKPRACLLLHLEGFDQEEIAELVGLGKKSVGTYLSMARDQFRRAYRQLEMA